MAVWKKVIVSGSQAELAAVTASIAVLVGSTQKITTSPSTTILSGSFSGSFSGAIVGGIATATSASVVQITDTTTGTGPYYLTFVDATSNHPAQRVDSTGLTYNATTNLISGTSSVAITSQTASVINTTTDNSATTYYIPFVGSATGVANETLRVDSGISYVPSTDTVTLAGDIAINGGDITTSAGSFNIATSATSVAIGATTNGSVVTVGDLAVNGATSADITTTNTTATIFNTTATSINAFGAATTLNVGAATGTASFAGNVVIAGGLDVNGTVTTIDTTNLLVADQFILLGSGSTANKDGGIIVQSAASAGSGFAFAYDDTTDRWYFQDALAATATSLGAISYLTTAAAVAAQRDTAANRPADGTGPLYGGTNGWGNMWIDSDGNNDIWIYV